MKKCPFCAEEIQDLAKKCKHCWEWLNKNNVEITANYERRTYYWTLILWVLIFISAFANPLNRHSAFTWFGLVLAAIAYSSISKRKKLGKSFWYGEVIAWTLLVLMLFLFDNKNVGENPMLIIGQSLFLSYYLYPIINRKIDNFYARLIVRTILVLISMVICTIWIFIINSFVRW